MRKVITQDVLKLRTCAKFILKNAFAFEWSLQGLGMLRLNLGDETRLHIWDLRHMFAGASPVHDHLQWALHSTVLSGHMGNVRYIPDDNGIEYMYHTIRAGYGCEKLHEPRAIRLLAHKLENFSVGDSYSQRPAEIHESMPVNGTVTIMRKAPTPDGETARVFWLKGTEWGTAEPRKATVGEVAEITHYALAQWVEDDRCVS